MMSIAILAIVLAVVGNYLYGKNVMRVESGVFSPVPWIIFFLLGANDFANYATTGSNIFELIAGFIVMAGPAIITSLIILKGSNDGRLRITIDSGEKIILFSAFTSIVIITLFELLVILEISFLGESWIFEWFALSIAIILDLIALLALRNEIRESPKDFERGSWVCFFIASGLASYYDYTQMGEGLNIIAFILIFENLLVSAVVIFWITRHK